MGELTRLMDNLENPNYDTQNVRSTPNTSQPAPNFMISNISANNV
jgi:hypothetical protein